MREELPTWEQILWMCLYGGILLLLVGASIMYAVHVFKGG